MIFHNRQPTPVSLEHYNIKTKKSLIITKYIIASVSNCHLLNTIVNFKGILGAVVVVIAWWFIYNYMCNQYISPLKL
jgi:ABC-type transporter Mla maintaining outer membrane lipid asymmetry permease subunit MlaE